MAKKPNNDPKKGTVKPTETVSAKEVTSPVLEEKPFTRSDYAFWKNSTLHQWLIFFFAFLLYANAIPNGYAVDDSIVIERNMFTKKGMKGMSGIWGKDTFVGFFGDERNLVSGGRYRPFTVATFALENQLFGTVNTNKNETAVFTSLVVKSAKKDAVLAKLGNPKNTLVKTSGDTLTLSLEIAPGQAIPDKDGDITYLGNPQVSHAINGILFGLLCMLLYMWLLLMFDPNKNNNFKAVFIAFTAAVLFAAHPLHVEAVANIKGRDEIAVTLFSILATYWTMKSIGSQRWMLYMAGAVISFFIALFSKESAIPFLVIIPAAIYFFQKEVDMPTIALRSAPFLVVVLVFWFGVRNPILKWAGKQPPAPELMNDPFMKMVPTGTNQRTYVPFSSDEKNGMILHTWVEYIRLLAVPHPLTNDYYPKHIGSVAQSTKPTGNSLNVTEMTKANGQVYYIKDDIPSFSSPQVLLSLLIHLAMAALALWGLTKRKPFAFALIFYAATFSVVSNLFFPIGTLMAERFMFMPSIAFSMLCAMGLAQLALKDGQFSPNKLMLPLAIFGIVTLLYSVKTFFRNFDWKDDYTLFTKDIAISSSSAKLNNAVSGVLQDHATKGTLTLFQKEDLYKRALIHSRNAINIHPTYNNAWLLYGNANIFLGNIREAQADSLRNAGKQPEAGAKYGEALGLYTEALKAYNEVNRLRPDHPDVPTNLTAGYRTLGKLYGEKLGKVPEALQNLEAANQWGKDKDVEVLRLMGVAYGITGIMSAQSGNQNAALESHAKAVAAFEKARLIAPKYVPTLFNLEVAYRELAKIDAAKQQDYLMKADAVTKEWRAIEPNYNPTGQPQQPNNPQTAPQGDKK